MSEEKFKQTNAWKAKFTDSDGEVFECVFDASELYQDVFEVLKEIDKEYGLTNDDYTLDSLEYIGNLLINVDDSTRGKP